MSRKAKPAAHASTVEFPVDALLELKALQNELISIAQTIDPADTSSPLVVRKHEQARRRALAKVFRLWAEQMDRSLSTMRPA